LQAVLSWSGTLFSTHNMQAPALVDPIGEIELPVPQTLHRALPVVSLYFPAAQRRQLPAVPVCPTPQSLSQVPAISVNEASQSQPVFPIFATLFGPHDVQELALMVPVGEIGVFWPQFIHNVLPTVSLYVPPAHFKQLPAVPVKPLAQSASHVPEMSVNKSIQTQPAFPRPMTLFSPHNVQALALVDPASEIGVLVSQPLHTALPCAALYVPAGHMEQLAAGPVYPMLHKHSVFSISGAEFTTHDVQALTPVDPEGEIEFPVPQILHAVFPCVFLYVPLWHMEQLAAGPVYPMLHKHSVFRVLGAEFTAHDVQTLTSVDPGGEIEFPVPQILHAVLPCVFLYVPAGHMEQLAAGPVYPMLHKHAVFSVFGPEFAAHGVQALAPMDEIDPVSQLSHTPAPRVFLYVPAPHCKQLPAVPVYPMLHKQAVFASSGPEFSAHDLQSPTTVDPTSEIEFELQISHTPLPNVFLYVPAAHCKQFAAFPV